MQSSFPPISTFSQFQHFPKSPPSPPSCVRHLLLRHLLLRHRFCCRRPFLRRRFLSATSFSATVSVFSVVSAISFFALSLSQFGIYLSPLGFQADAYRQPSLLVHFACLELGVRKLSSAGKELQQHQFKELVVQQKAQFKEFTDKLIEDEELVAGQKEQFKDFVKEKVREAKKANREVKTKGGGRSASVGGLSLGSSGGEDQVSSSIAHREGLQQLWIDGATLMPSGSLSTVIRDSFKTYMSHEGFTWRLVPDNTMEIYFNEFKKSFYWDPAIDKQVYDKWMEKASERYSKSGSGPSPPS